MGVAVPEISVAIRSGDTPAEERRRFASKPSDILITTPESLFLLLTSQAREALREVETVIVDEVHAVAGTKRGAHLALTLERLDALLPKPAQRVGLSATVRPASEVAAFLGGVRPAKVVQPPSEKQIEIDVVVPVEDMAEITSRDDGEPNQRSIWPHVEEHLLDLIEAHRSTIIFANSRRLSERLCSRLNELAYERSTSESMRAGVPAELMAAGRGVQGAIPEVVRAHHGSVSKEERSQIEEALKSGRLPAVVATSSLELGIDMGSVDLVACVEAPPSVASGLQRVGRAGHQVGAVSRGVIFPKYRGDLVQTAVVAERMKGGQIEELRYPRNALDVLAQQIVAMTALDEWTVDELETVVRRAAPYADAAAVGAGGHPRHAGRALPQRGVRRAAPPAGVGPGDRNSARASRRPAARRHQRRHHPRPGPVRRVPRRGEGLPGRGARRGDGVRIPRRRRLRAGRDVVADRGHHGRPGAGLPAPGLPGKLPFWKGDPQGRPAELGRAIGAFVRELAGAGPAAGERVRAAGLDEFAAGNLIGYLAEQREATGYVPDDRTLLVERFHDELGDWRVIIHSPPSARGSTRPGRWPSGGGCGSATGSTCRPSTPTTGSSFGCPTPSTRRRPTWRRSTPRRSSRSSPRNSAGPPCSRPGSASAPGASLAAAAPHSRRRSPLWQQRQRSAHLLGVAAKYAGFPVVLETMRECLQDVFDVPGLVRLMRDISARRLRVVEVETRRGLAVRGVAAVQLHRRVHVRRRRAAGRTARPGPRARHLSPGRAAWARPTCGNSSTPT